VLWLGNLREGHYLENPGIDGRILLSWIFRKWNGDTNLTDLAQDRERWWVLVHAVMNFRVL